MIYLQRVEAVKIPPRIKQEKFDGQYGWRMAEGMPAFAKAVDALILTETRGGDYFMLAFQQIAQRFQPTTEWKAYQVARAALGLDTHAREALCDEVDRSLALGEEGLWDTMLGKIDYMTKNDVRAPEAFLKKRDNPVKYKKK